MGFNAFFVTNVRQQLRPDIEYYLDAYEITPCLDVIPNRLALSICVAVSRACSPTYPDRSRYTARHLSVNNDN
jgi:hypothetical protein